MASTRHYSMVNLSPDGRLRFQSNRHYNWKENPRMDVFRRSITNLIRSCLSQSASGDFVPEIASLASWMEDEHFKIAPSLYDYLDKKVLFDRIKSLIEGRFLMAQSREQQYLHSPKPLSTDSSTSTFGVPKNDFGSNISKNFPYSSMTSNNGGNLVPSNDLSRLYSSTDAPMANLQGPKKRTFATAFQQYENSSPTCPPTEGYPCGKLVDSAPTFSGRVLHYDAGASTENHHHKSRCSGEGDLNAIVASSRSSPVVQVPSMGSKISSVLSGQRGQLEHSGRNLMLNEDVHVDRDGADGTLPPPSVGISDEHSFNEIHPAVVYKLLSCYMRYSKNRLEPKVPFLEMFHSLKCSADMCHCESYSKLLSHFDKCGIADCNVCGPSVTKHSTNHDRNSNMSTRLTKLNACAPRCESSCIASALPENLTGLSGPLNIGGSTGAPLMASSDNREPNMWLLTSHVDDLTKKLELGARSVDEVLTGSFDGIASLAEGPSTDENMELAAQHELEDKGTGSFCNVLSDTVCSLCKGKIEGENDGEMNELEMESKPTMEDSPSSIAALAERKCEIDYGSVDDVLTGNFNGAASPVRSPSADGNMELAAQHELEDKGPGSFCNDGEMNDQLEMESKPTMEDCPSSIVVLAERKGEIDNGSVDYVLTGNFNGAASPVGSPSADENMELAAQHELEDKGTGSFCNVLSDSVRSLCKGKIEAENDGEMNDLLEMESKPTMEDSPSSIVALAERKCEINYGSVDDVLTGNFNGAAIPVGSLSVDENMELAAQHELEDKGTDSLCNFLPDYVPSLSEGKIESENDGVKNDKLEMESKPTMEYSPSLIERKCENKKMKGISLIDFFTTEEIREHLSGLRLKDDKGTVDEVMGSPPMRPAGDYFCQLCNLGQLSFPPMPIYCSSCGLRIKNYQSYYSTSDEEQAQFCFCTQCHHRFRGGNISFHGLSVSKNKLKLEKNNLVMEESWVECDKCQGWQHQICALFNDKRNLGDKVEYICARCHLEGLGSVEGMTSSRITSWDASKLPQTLLSDHLEDRLFKRLKQERENCANVSGKCPEDVPQPAELVVRVVSSVDKRLKVKQQFLDVFADKSYPAEFPYRSKVILLFQRIEGVDVCLFAMYVQEFGSDCSQPNQRCVYISYLDSVKYFRPDIKTAKGEEALRTFVYHELLVGYLDYCKKRGFATCYIWACPPMKGEDYIFYCHPESQKTPRPEKLRQWYQSMLKKATKEKVVVNFTNLYEKFFVASGENNTKVSAARLPYFDGDYWSGVAENMIKKIEQESGGDPEKQIKKMTRRSLKAMGHTNPSAHDAKDILLMQELAKAISSAKEDFIIVYLHPICTHCHEVILSGKRWFCNQCKNFQLCERCREKEESSGLGGTHISTCSQNHVLCQELVNDVPIDTEDHDTILNNCFLESRQAFLNFCQGNLYQFDSIRRAKHSSMMILYHLHNPNVSNAGVICSLCFKDIDADTKWTCEMCPDFVVCSVCYDPSNPTCHNHTLTSHAPSIPPVCKITDDMAEELMDLVLHSSQCSTHPCPYPKCKLIKKLFAHTINCSVRLAGGCLPCRKAWLTLQQHFQRCNDSHCRVPRCTDHQQHVKRKTGSKTRCGKVLPDASWLPL